MVKAAWSVALFWHLAALTIWLLPAFPAKQALVPLLRPYMWATGLWQEWGMFAPDPLTENFHLEAEVDYADGSVRRVEFPRMSRLSLSGRYQKERYRKWSEQVRPDTSSRLWPDIARWVARRYNADPRNPPRAVRLSRHWDEIPPPAPRDYQPMPRAYPHANSHTFFTYRVEPGDLQ